MPPNRSSHTFSFCARENYGRYRGGGRLRLVLVFRQEFLQEGFLCGSYSRPEARNRAAAAEVVATRSKQASRSNSISLTHISGRKRRQNRRATFSSSRTLPRKGSPRGLAGSEIGTPRDSRQRRAGSAGKDERREEPSHSADPGGRQAKPEGAQPIVEVLPEGPFLHAGLNVVIGGCDDPDVNGNDVIAPEL